MVLGLSAELVTWHSSSAVGVVPILASALVVTTVVAVRRALRRASAQIESILDEELDARPPNGL